MATDEIENSGGLAISNTLDILLQCSDKDWQRLTTFCLPLALQPQFWAFC